MPWSTTAQAAVSETLNNVRALSVASTPGVPGGVATLPADIQIPSLLVLDSSGDAPMAAPEVGRNGGWVFHDHVGRGGQTAALDVVANFQPLWACADDYINELTLPFICEETAR